jgi:hypothetical protein
MGGGTAGHRVDSRIRRLRVPSVVLPTGTKSCAEENE